MLARNHYKGILDIPGFFSSSERAQSACSQSPDKGGLLVKSGTALHNDRVLVLQQQQ